MRITRSTGWRGVSGTDTAEERASREISNPKIAPTSPRHTRETSDLDTLDDLLADDVIYTHSDASVDTKTSYLDMLRSGRLVYLAVEHTTDLVLSMPGVAIVAGTMSGSIRMHGAAKTLNSRVAAVWLSQGGRWRLAAFQPTPIRGQPSDPPDPGVTAAADTRH